MGNARINTKLMGSGSTFQQISEAKDISNFGQVIIKVLMEISLFMSDSSPLQSCS